MPAFHEARFPVDIARGVVYGPGFKTTVVSMDSGYEQRNIDWSKIRSTGNIGTGLRKKDDSGALTGYYTARTFFMERRGKAHGFRFKNWSDYQAATELLVASAVGGETSATLVKTYGSVNPYVRTIYKPVSGTVQLFKNGSGTPLGSVSVNTVTGVVTFPALTAADSLRWTGEFDDPVRFDIDEWPLTLEMYNAGEVANIPIVELKLKTDGQG